jgi:mannose-6-phosphate isomerase
MSETQSPMIPFRIEPRFVTRVWGWRDLRPWFDRVAEGDPIGEVWLTGDDCEAASGPFAGRRLAEVFRAAGELMTGPGAPDNASPLLIKILFAREKLSVQVHPDDEMARRLGHARGKTECWYALQADPGALVAVGLKPGTTVEKVAEGIAQGTLESSLNMVSVEEGETIYVNAGAVHAVWPGSVLLETQQNCDLTYRMYDYGRPRELHVEKALEALRFGTRAGRVEPRQLADRSLLLDAEYFRIERIPVAGSRTSASLRGEETVPRLAYLFAASGSGQISGAVFEPVELPARGIVAVPAASPDFVLEDRGGLDLIRITPNRPDQAR